MKEREDRMVGEPAPGFCLPGADEREVCLEEYAGRWLVLYFYPRDNSSGCTLEARTFSGELDEFAAIGARIVGVSPDSPASHKKFAESKELRVCLLSDEEHAVMEEYGVWKKKRMYGREFMGVERSHVPHRSGGGHPCDMEEGQGSRARGDGERGTPGTFIRRDTRVRPIPREKETAWTAVNRSRDLHVQPGVYFPMISCHSGESTSRSGPSLEGSGSSSSSLGAAMPWCRETTA